MIITKYLTKEALKSQLIFFFMLLLAFFCQKLVKIFSAVIDGKVPTNLIFLLLSLGIPEMIQFVLPLSLFLGLLVTFSKLYTKNEIIVMYACGFNKLLLIKVAMILALFTSTITILNLTLLEPWSSSQQNRILAEIKNNPSIIALVQGQFQKMNNGNLVLFTENVNDNKFNNIFLVQLHSDNNRSSIIVADSGQIMRYKNGSQIMFLNNGMHFEITKKLRNFFITTFQHYQVAIDYHDITLNFSDAEINIFTLWNPNKNYIQIELHWRLTLIFALFMMSLMVLPLSIINPHHERSIYMLLAMLLYLIFFLVQTFIKSSWNENKYNPILCIWLINIIYLLLAILLNLFDTTLVRRIRAFFICKKIRKECHNANILRS